MPKCTINGTQLEVKEGTTVIQAMKDNGMSIAHYCWHPGLSVAGVCRLCMVEISGNPRLQIGCNTAITEGMVINNTSDKVKDSVKWGLDFHLINHPLDCPVCDQAGECQLQEQYMEYGKYTPEMAEKKVKKHKVVDLGPTVVLDSERCILCSRCVRFTDEVSKTHELGIFNRGDRSEIGTFDGKPLNNKYSLNTVDICPVGALTSKDFRFRQRVWFLKDETTVCNGCSTGCRVRVYYNKNGFFRVKPEHNPKINGYWMCDDGRDIYKFANREHRYIKAQKKTSAGWAEMIPGAAAKEASAVLKSQSAGGIALVLTGQYTLEEYEASVGVFINELKTKNIYHWTNQESKWNEFDGLLIRGDKNPNSAGLKKVLAKYGIANQWSDLMKKIESGAIQTVIVAGPEVQLGYDDYSTVVNQLSSVKNIIWLQSTKNPALETLKEGSLIIPMKSFVEKEGTFVNYSGLEQNVKRIMTVVSEALTLSDATRLLAGQNVVLKPDIRESKIKNEFTFHRGPL